jgi:hypothetical protein
MADDYPLDPIAAHIPRTSSDRPSQVPSWSQGYPDYGYRGYPKT